MASSKGVRGWSCSLAHRAMRVVEGFEETGQAEFGREMVPGQADSGGVDEKAGSFVFLADGKGL